MPEDRAIEATSTDEYGPFVGNHGGNPEGWDRALHVALVASVDEIAASLDRPGDPIEVALVDAVHCAAVAGEWAALEALARELEARRHARAGVPDLAVERARRGR